MMNNNFLGMIFTNDFSKKLTSIADNEVALLITILILLPLAYYFKALSFFIALAINQSFIYF